MLEHPALWIGPAPPGTALWLIREPADRRLLGLARPRPASSFWTRWLSAPTLEIREGDDEALLCTIDRYRGLQTRWIVRDADERLVGQLRGGALWDPLDRLLTRAVDAHHWRLPDGQPVASFQHDQDGILLTFHGNPNPFLRMLLLAAAGVSLTAP